MADFYTAIVRAIYPIVRTVLKLALRQRQVCKGRGIFLVGTGPGNHRDRSPFWMQILTRYAL